MDAPWWLEKWLNAPWFEKLFWVFFVVVPLWILGIWIRMLWEMFDFRGPRPARRAPSNGGGAGFSDGTSADLMSFDSASSDSGSSDSGSDSSSDSGGGSDFSGGGGESGGGGASGSWS